MERIDNSGNYQGGYFIKNELVETASFTGGDGFVVTCQQDRGLLQEMIYQAKEAKHYIKICSFIVDNKQIFDVLIDHLKKGQIAVFVLTAVNDQSIQSDLLNEEDDNDLRKSRHLLYISELVQAGAHVRASYNAHAKFMIRDGKEALLMSANLTEPSLNNNEKNNPPNDESGIILSDPEEVFDLEQIFDAVFLYGTEFKKFITLKDKSQLIDQKEPDIIKHDFPSLNGKVLLSYEQYHSSIYKEILAHIAQAQQMICVSSYSVVALENLPGFTAAIKDFIVRGGRVILFCRAMNHRSDHLKGCKILADLGVTIYADMFNHSKGLYSDLEEGIVFTANIDGKHGLINGFEVGYKLKAGHRSFAKFREFTFYQQQTAPFIYKVNPAKQELNDFYKHWYKCKQAKPIAIPETLEIKYRAGAILIPKFIHYLQSYPVFYSKTIAAQKVFLQFEIFDTCYALEELNESTLNLIKEVPFKEQFKGEKYLYCYQSISLVSYER
ncbi:phospholipase D-like domain-containing protein [Mucilaginibacter terrae]|uniref:PLD phosphodiesterase domain-containing protein n=1 Tax=Mucilaginibacter terrae TaxID=1955052 RepID=A0ABU3GW05_9SPHI|nr:phospholipase D-like domain-containing protein [Mucilaginibacter terrae]MDT3403781.1 hypothetical protein [Mucilaginibacter terrae]